MAFNSPGGGKLQVEALRPARSPVFIEREGFREVLGAYIRRVADAEFLLRKPVVDFWIICLRSRANGSVKRDH